MPQLLCDVPDRIYEDFFNAIIEKACEDYVKARLKIIKRIGRFEIDLNDLKYEKVGAVVINSAYMCRDCLRFFYSDYFKSLTEIDPDYLVKNLDNMPKWKSNIEVDICAAKNVDQKCRTEITLKESYDAKMVLKNGSKSKG